MKINTHKDSQVQKNITEYKKIFYRWLQSGQISSADRKKSEELLLQLNSDFIFVSVAGKKLSIMEIEFMKDSELSEELIQALTAYREVIEIASQSDEDPEYLVIAEAFIQTILASFDDDIRLWFPEDKFCHDFYSSFGIKPHEEVVLIVKVKTY